MPVHGVCRNFVLLSLQLKTKKRKKVGMSQKPSYLCIVNQTKTVDYCMKYKEYWADGEEHYEDIKIVCQKLENGPVAFENPWR